MKLGKYKITTKEIIIFLSAVIVVFNLYSLAWFPPQPHVYRGLFLTIFIIVTLLLNPPKSKIGKVSMAILTSMALVGSIYPMVFEAKLRAQYYYAAESDIYFAIIFFIGFAAVLTRTAGGRIILGMLGVATLYLFWGQHIPGYFGHSPFPLHYVASIFYTSGNVGVFGDFMAIACRLISVFIMFAALLITTGLGDLSTALSTRIAGNATGGPAKVAVFSSGAFGMLCGSATSNVAATGSFTIPVMKSIGYKPSTAASVEALASAGGGMMPPIMASIAFIMADMLGISYFRVCLAAVIPVFLWYFTLYVVVHYYALRQGIKKWRPPREEFMKVIRAKWHLAFAIPVLVGALFYFVSAEQAAFFAVIFLFILANLRKSTRLTKAKVAEFLERYARMFAPLLILIAALSVFVAAFIGSGACMKLGVVLLGGIEQWYIILLITAALIIALGMALPLVATYLATILLIGPILAELGYNLLVIHMFVFALALLAPVTPPVCLATFTAAKIAGSDMMKTGVEATIRGLPLWIIPFSIFRKELLLGIGTPLSAIGMGVAMLCFGVFMFVLGTEGFFQRELKLFERILAIATGLMIVQPVSDFYAKIFIVVGILLVAYWYWPHLFEKIKVKKAQGY